MGRGLALVAKGRAGEALVDFDRAIENNPANPLGFAGRGLAMLASGQPDRAIGAFDAAIANGGEDAFAYSARGRAFLAKGQTDRALADFDLDTTNHYQSKSITDFSATATAMLGHFKFSRTISDVAGRTDASGVSNMKVIVLTAQWTGVDGMSHTLKYTSYYAKDGLYAYYST